MSVRLCGDQNDLWGERTGARRFRYSRPSLTRSALALRRLADRFVRTTLGLSLPRSERLAVADRRRLMVMFVEVAAGDTLQLIDALRLSCAG